MMKCIVQGCNKKAVGVRGLCKLHLRNAKHGVETGHVTWEKLEEIGGALPVAKCLHCNSNARTRGLCFKCYQTLRTAVLGGKTTWEKLEEAGLSAKPARTTGRPKSKIRLALEEFLEHLNNEQPSHEDDVAEYQE